MRIIDSCAACLYDKQEKKCKDPAYLQEIRALLDNRHPEDTSPYMVYQFALAYERRFGKSTYYGPIKKRYNDLVLSMEKDLEQRILMADDPLASALACARIGNYIDFGAMNEVDSAVFLQLFENASLSSADQAAYTAFLDACRKACTFLLITDNCGEIVLDKLFLRQLKARFPQLQIQALVRGAEVLNDATPEDAHYTGLDQEAQVLSNGKPLAGTIYTLLPDDAKASIDGADVILAKGQGNYESLSQQGGGLPPKHMFYAFLCKCDLFTDRFHVPPLTGIFVEEDLH